jgi:hypothetical protein
LNVPLVILSSCFSYGKSNAVFAPPPTVWENTQAACAGRALDHFKILATFRLAPRSQLLAPLRRISPDLFETWVQGSEWGEQASGTFPIVEISRRHVHGQKQNERIDWDMTLASFHECMRIESADRGGLLNGFDALRIQDGRTGLRVPPEVFAFSRSQGRQQTKPGAFEAQVAKMVEPSFCKSPVP